MEATVYLEDNEYIALCDKIRGGEVIEFDGARLEIADGYDPEE